MKMRGVKSKATLFITTTLLALWIGNVSADNEYMVEKGDSLSKIGKLLGVPWKEIMKANNLKNTVIHPNQILIIPSAGRIYNNENPTKPAHLVNSPPPEFLDKETIVATPVVVQPEAASAIPAPPVPQPPIPNPVVVINNNTTSDDRADIQRSYSEAVYIPPIQGNSRARPSRVEPPNTYMVKNGDTVWSISRNFGLTLRELQKANNMKHSKIYPGQVLSIPDKVVVASN